MDHNVNLSRASINVIGEHETFLDFLSFLDMAQVVENIPGGRQGPVTGTYTMSIF